MGGVCTDCDRFGVDFHRRLFIFENLRTDSTGLGNTI